MNITIKIALVVIIGLALTMGAGCATSKVWISSPAAQTAGNPYYEAKIEPLKSANKFRAAKKRQQIFCFVSPCCHQ
jgi:hypothetical protein